MADTLLELKISENGGNNSSIERTVIVSQTITFYNLHRAVQYCVKPRQSDSTVDGKVFDFKHIPTQKAIKAPKTAQVHKHSSNSGEARIGVAFTYTADDKRYRLEVTDKCRGDGRYHVPRCVAGKNGTQPADLDTTNSKLLVRKFSKIGSGQKKKAKPSVVSSELAQMNSMKRPLRWWRADSGSLEVELLLKGEWPRECLVQQAIKAAGPEAAAEVPYPEGADDPVGVTTAAAHDSHRSAVQEPAAAETDSVPVSAAEAPAQASLQATDPTPSAVTANHNVAVAASVDATETAGTAAPAVLASSQAGNKVPVAPRPVAAGGKGTLLSWLTKQPAKQ